MDGLDEDDDVEKHKNRGFCPDEVQAKTGTQKIDGTQYLRSKIPPRVANVQSEVSLDGVAAPEEHFLPYDVVCKEVLQELKSEVSSSLVGLTYGR